MVQARGQELESPLLGRTDFEHLEMQALRIDGPLRIDGLAEHLEKRRAALLPATAGNPPQ